MATKVLSKVKIANYICIKTAKITHASSSKKHKIPHRRNISKKPHSRNIFKIQYITSLKGAKNDIPITQTHDRSHIK